MSLLAAILIAVLAYVVFDTLTSVLVVLLICAVVLYIANNGNRRF